MDRDNVIQSLIDLGLSTGEAKTYIKLVETGPSEATPLAESAGVPQPKIYEYLRALSTKNLIMEYDSRRRARTYEAIDYNVALDLLEKVLQKKIQTTREYFKKNIEIEKEEKDQLITYKTGETAVNIAIEDIFSKSKKNIMFIENHGTSNLMNTLLKRYKLERINFLHEDVQKLEGIHNIIDPFRNVLQEISTIQPAFVISDIDIKMGVARLSAIISPSTKEIEPMIIIFKHQLIINYQTKFLLGLIRSITDTIKNKV